jgi:hypothetical protein
MPCLLICSIKGELSSLMNLFFPIKNGSILVLTIRVSFHISPLIEQIKRQGIELTLQPFNQMASEPTAEYGVEK